MAVWLFVSAWLMCGMSRDALISSSFSVSNYTAANMALFHAVRPCMFTEFCGCMCSNTYQHVCNATGSKCLHQTGLKLCCLQCTLNGQSPTVAIKFKRSQIISRKALGVLLLQVRRLFCGLAHATTKQCMCSSNSKTSSQEAVYC